MMVRSKTSDDSKIVASNRRTLTAIPANLMVEILSYCDASDMIFLLRASRSFFATPLQLYLCSINSISLSFLLKTYPNSFKENQGQQIAVRILLKSLLPSHPTRNQLKRLEFSNLRGITGSIWLPELRNLSLVTLDFTNCTRLDSELLLGYLDECPTTLRHLHLNGCKSVGPDIIDCIGGRHQELLSLSLGACSQTLRTPHVFRLLRNLNSLKHIDLQGLTHIKDREFGTEDYFVDKLPDSIESINLSGTKPLRLVCPDAYKVMNTYLNRSLEYTQATQVRVQNVQDRLRVRNNIDVDVEEIIHRNRDILDCAADVYIWRNEDSFRLKIKHLVLDGAGHPRSGIFRGSIAMFSLGRSLREVHLSGCESVNDWEIQALAVNCSKTLRCFQMRAGRIGNGALEALAKHCRVLGEVDVSACFEIGDDGIIALSRHLHRKDSSREPEVEDTGEFPLSNKRRRFVRSSLSVLRAASLPKLTNKAIEAISSMESLIVLDIQNCVKISPSTAHKTVQKLPFLVEINAKDIALGSPSLSVLLCNDACVHRTLKFVNQRVFIPSMSISTTVIAASKTTIIARRPNDDIGSCCTVLSQSQRLAATVTHAPMYHCVDCKLIPALDRGFCIECLRQCHKGHETFLGSYCSFYCDCPFVADANMCQAIPASIANSQTTV